MYRLESNYDYHYQSAIPLAPGTGPPRRTSFSPPTLHTGIFIQDYPSPNEPGSQEGEYLAAVSPRPERPDVPCTPQMGPTPTMADSSTFAGPAPSLRGSRPRHTQQLLPSFHASTSPPRPRRPSRPGEARMFDLLHHSSGSSAESVSQPPTSTSFPVPPPLPTATVDPPSPRPVSTLSSRRKPVPKFIPDPPPESPFNTSLDGHAAPESARLSIGGFEALLKRSSAAASGEDADGQVVWSPRIHLGLDDRGVQARDERLRRDQAARERDVGELVLAGLRDDDEDDEAPAALDDPERTPRQRDPRGRTRHATFDDLHLEQQAADLRTPPRQVGRETGSTRRFLTPRSTVSPRSGGGAQGRTPRSRMTSYNPQYDRPLEEEEREEDVRVVERSGPVLRRGSKRLSELASVVVEDFPRELDETAESSPSLAGTGVGKGRKGSSVLLKSKRSKSATSASTAKGKAAKKSLPRGKSVSEVEVVVHDSTTGSEGESASDAWDALSGEWERIRRETTCRPERMNWSLIDFEGWFPRLCHLVYPFFVFAHVPMTLFLDYNLLYLLIQLALSPALPSAALQNLATRALVSMPDIEGSTGLWIAVGIYAACTAAWFFGVFLWRELGRGLFKQWGEGGKTVEIERVYAGAASYNLACVRSYSVFSFLWRVRLAPFQSSSALAVAVEGTTWTDGVKETLSWYKQNWPTVLLLLPRAGISVAILFLYDTTAYGSSTVTTLSRDSAYFDRDGTLSSFAAGVLFANTVWAALRLLVFLIALVGFWLADRPSFFRRRDEPYSQYYHPSREHLTISSPLPLLDDKSAPFSPPVRRPSVVFATWRTRRQRRIRAAILACLGSTPLTQSSGTFSPFFKSPYVLGFSPTLQGEKAHLRPVKLWDNDEKRSTSTAEEKEHESDRRRAELSRRGERAPSDGRITVEHEGGPMMSSPRPIGSLWSSASRYVLPAPQIPQSPLISFSPATPPVPTFDSPGAVGESTSAQPRRESLAAVGESTGDLGESRLHRRVRSLTAKNDGLANAEAEHPELIRFEAMSPASPLPYLPSPSAHTRAPPPPPLPARQSSSFVDVPPSSSSGGSSQSPALSLSLANLTANLGRPPLVSRFSAFSSLPGSSAQSSPGLDPRRPLPASSYSMTRDPSASSSFASPGPPPRLTPLSLSGGPPTLSPQAGGWLPPPSPTAPAPAPADPSLSPRARALRSACTEAQLQLAEQQQLSARLLDEVQRLHAAEAALAREERRGQTQAGSGATGGAAGGALRRISEATSRTGTASASDEYEYATAASRSPPLPALPSPPLPSPPQEAEDTQERNPHRASASSAWSQPSSVGGQSESSTLRGAVRTPDLARLLRSPHRASAATSVSGSGVGAVLGAGSPVLPGLEPFRLSYSSEADGLSLSAYGSPDMTGVAQREGRFAGTAEGDE
ncbi:hypothetical protein JCM10207_006090 [Rhodosporidiobolus poonsookiae]